MSIKKSEATKTLNSLTVEFTIDGVQHRLIMDTSNFKNNTFENGVLEFKVTDYPSEGFGLAEHPFTKEAFHDIWRVGHEILFDIDAKMVEEAGDIILEHASIKPSKLKPFPTSTFTELDDFDQELLKPFKEGRVVTGMVLIIVKGSGS